MSTLGGGEGAARFDALVQAVIIDGTRRDLARTLGALVFGGGLALASPPRATARKCPPCRRKKKGKCRAKRPNGTLCGNSGTCQNGRCVTSFCAGKNECVEFPARCERSGAECFCWVTTTGRPFCGRDANILNDCSQCTGEAVCIDASGPECGGQTACSLPCPDPL